jgi:ABC-type amino acid transport/signal transduction systems, periplasmic component/domain
MKVTIAYIEEPPFGWTKADRIATGADIELAEVVLRAIGATVIEHRLTTFSELLPGVEVGRWDMNVPLFVTPERANLVAFSVPVWAMGDGFLVRAGNPKSLDSYASLAKRSDARLGIIAGQVQHDSARASRVSEDQIEIFEHQADAIGYRSRPFGRNRCLCEHSFGKPHTGGSYRRFGVRGRGAQTGNEWQATRASVRSILIQQGKQRPA